MAFKDTKVRNEYLKEYRKENQERLNLIMRKGEPDLYKALAKSLGMTVTQMFRESIQARYPSEWASIRQAHLADE